LADARGAYAGMLDGDGNLLPEYMADFELRQEMERAKTRRPEKSAACEQELRRRGILRANHARLLEETPAHLTTFPF
jgi:hypothetical protein